MANTISIIIQAQDNASKKIRQLGDEVKATGDKSDEAGKKVFKLNDHLGALATVAAGAGVATYGLLNYMNQSITAANNLDSALLGLNSVATAFGNDADKAKKAAQELASDGLMTVTESATGLKNLLAAGFNLEQAIALMRRFKDSAAFGRQASLSFGQAVASATEGIKNGNSILVDNAGVTKNLSVMLKEAGLSVNDLGNASSDATVRQAIFNGIMRETNAQVGDAAALSETAAGKQQKWSAQTLELQQRIGSALQPALLGLLETATPVIEVMSDWVAKNPELTAGILVTATTLGGLITMAAGVGLAVAGLGPVFTLFSATSQGAIGGAATTFGGFKALVRSPIVMPALAVGAALIAIQQVWDAYNRMQSAINEAQAAASRSWQTTLETKAAAERAFAAGDNAKGSRLMTLWQNSLKADLQRAKTDPYMANATRNSGYALSNQVSSGVVPTFASGTNYAPGGISWVGEHGPEPVILPQGAQVIPSYQSREATRGGGHTVIIENYNSYNERDDKRFLRDVGFQLELAS